LNAIAGGLSARLTGLKFPAQFHKPGWKFQQGLKLSSCNCKRLFKKEADAKPTTLSFDRKTPVKSLAISITRKISFVSHYITSTLILHSNL